VTCSEVQANLSFYLYGELDFTTEEWLEAHLGECAACQKALDRERSWHECVAVEQSEVPLDFLSQCRQELRETLGIAKEASQPGWIGWIDALGLKPSPWSMRLAMASLLICLGFGVSRLMERNGLPGPEFPYTTTAQMGMLNPSQVRIRSIEPSSGNQIQLVVDEINEHVISGTWQDEPIRQLLLSAAKDPTDPALRVDSVEILKNESGDDVRDTLLDVAQHDPSAGVRMKALAALGRFDDDPATRHAIAYVLEHDVNPDVRTQAIDLLVPSPASLAFSPQLAGTLQQLMRTEQNDYIRTRCQRALAAMNASSDVY
jgi:hypothetical protein